MNLYPVNAGHFKLDGGAMFGVVPKSIWNKLNPADENNMCSWAMRCLLVEDGDRLILIDNGMGDKQSEKFFGYYYRHGDDSLEKSFARHGFSFDDVTDVFLSHLHFDHCGGSIRYNADHTKTEPAFRNAAYWSDQDHWNWAANPNVREKASFLKENILPIQESGQLRFVEKNSDPFPGFSVLRAYGHTEAMMIPHITRKGKTVVFVSDLVPSAGHIPLPYIMSYDVRPLAAMEEKKLFLDNAIQHGYILFFEHDPVHECCILEMTERGPRMKEAFRLSDLGA